MVERIRAALEGIEVSGIKETNGKVLVTVARAVPMAEKPAFAAVPLKPPPGRSPSTSVLKTICCSMSKGQRW